MKRSTRRNSECGETFDHFSIEKGGPLEVRYRLPYSDIEHFDELKMRGAVNDTSPMEFGHTLDDLIGVQLTAGFIITTLFKDDWDTTITPLNEHTACFIATLARKLDIAE